VSAVTPTARVVRRKYSGKNSTASDATDWDGGQAVFAMSTAAERSSSLTQAALEQLKLGG
jgi:hypothetical protein